MMLHVKTSPAPLHGQPRIDQPGAGQPGRECDQIRQSRFRPAMPLGADVTAGSRDILIEATAATAIRCCSVSPIMGPVFRKPIRGHAVERFVRLEASPYPAGLRARPQPGVGGGRRCTAAISGSAMPIPDWRATLCYPPRATVSATGVGGPNTGCATEGGMSPSAPDNADQRLSGRAIRRRAASVRPSRSRTTSGRLARRFSKQGQAGGDQPGAPRQFPPRPVEILLGIAEASPYLFDLPARRCQGVRSALFDCDPGPPSGTAHRRQLPRRAGPPPGEADCDAAASVA